MPAIFAHTVKANFPADLYCPWARDLACNLLQVRTDAGQSRDSLALPTYFLSPLITLIVERLDPAFGERVARKHELPREPAQFDL
jgi:hypothetical protein